MDRPLARAETGSTGSGSDVPLPEDLVTCPITFEPYQLANDDDGDDFVPYDPPCHHTLSKIALKDIIAQAEPIKWRCPTCQQALPSNDINDYQPNRFALGVLEAIDAARVRALKNRDIAVGVALGVQDGEGAFGDAGGENQQEDGEAMLPEEAQLPDGWPQTCAQFDILELGGTLQRFQAQQDVVARHRNGLVSSGIISIGGHDTRVAVKLVLPTDVAGNEDVGVAARRETAALAHATRHVPAAVLALKGFLDAGNFMIAQEVPGSSLINHLQKLIKEQAGLKASAWLELMLQLVDCLRQLHGCGIIHCDISPASVVRSATGILKLTDFSSARLCAPPDDGSSLLAARVATFPSRRVAYLAPEQLIQVAARTKHQILQRGGAIDAPPRRMLSGSVTDRTDIWAFAVFALHLWTGVPPTRGVTPNYAPPNLPGLLRDLFMGCLHSSPEKRPSASEVYEHLCLITDLKEDIPEFAADTEISVGVPAAASKPPVRRVSAVETGQRAAAPAAAEVEPPAAPAAAAPAVHSPRTPDSPPHAPAAAAAPAPAPAPAKPHKSAHELALEQLQREREAEEEKRRAAKQAKDENRKRGMPPQP